jgi:hypothetical protein
MSSTQTGTGRPADMYHLRVLQSSGQKHALQSIDADEDIKVNPIYEVSHENTAV